MHNFKKALKSTCLLLLCIIIILTILFEGYFRTEEYDTQDAAVRKEMAGSVDTFFCGASQGMDSFVPKMYDERFGTTSYNLSMANMSMKGRYVLLKKEIERNPVETVFLELSYDSLSRDKNEEHGEGDIYELSRFDNIFERVGYFFGNIRFSDYPAAFHDVFQKSLNCWPKIIRGNLSEAMQWETHGYKSLGVTDLTVTDEEAKRVYYNESLPVEIQDDNYKYLTKIIELCSSHGVKVVFVAVPIADEALLKYDNYDTVYMQYCEIAEKFDVEYYDFNLIKGHRYSNDISFANTYHMSAQGAQMFTEDFIRIMSDVADGKDVSSEFYNSYTDAICARYPCLAD